MIMRTRSERVGVMVSMCVAACGGVSSSQSPRGVESLPDSALTARGGDNREPSVICGGVVESPIASGPKVIPTLQWQIATGNRIVATPVEIGGDIVVGSLDGKLYRVSKDGALLATTDTGAGIQASAAPLSSTRDLLIGNSAGHLLRVAPDGTIVWRLRLHGPVETAPLFAPKHSMYVAADGVYRINRLGHILWHHVEATTVYEQPTRTADGGITFSTVDGRVVTLAADARVIADEIRPPIVDDAPPPPPTAVIDRDGNRYFVTSDQLLVATLGDGTPLWRYSLGANVAGSVLLTSTGTLVVGADDGILYALH